VVGGTAVFRAASLFDGGGPFFVPKSGVVMPELYHICLERTGYV